MCTQAVFLVGGRGTRLGTLSDTTPKPLLPVAGRPFLDHLIIRAREQGIVHVILLGGHLGEQMEAYAKSWRERGMNVECVIEPEPAGTGGALHHARARLEEMFFLCNGDSFFEIDLRDLANVGDGENTIARLALRPLADAGRFGRVTCEGERIVGFEEKGSSAPGLINGGIYLLSRAIFDFLPPAPCSIEKDVFPALITAGRIFGRPYNARFIDIGVPADLARSHDFFAPGSQLPAL